MQYFYCLFKITGLGSISQLELTQTPDNIFRLPGVFDDSTHYSNIELIFYLFLLGGFMFNSFIMTEIKA